VKIKPAVWMVSHYYFQEEKKRIAFGGKILFIGKDFKNYTLKRSRKFSG
jgi:hypothetical protein